MNILSDKLHKVFFHDGYIHLIFNTALQIKFPVKENPRLSKGTLEELNHIEISPFGLHWPDLDEDLSFDGIIKGNYGQPLSNKKQVSSQN